MQAVSPHLAAPASQRHTICTDLPCSRCGANLRGLGWDDECRECSLKTSQSLSVAAARAGDAEQLGRLASSLGTQQWAASLGALAAICSAMAFASNYNLSLLAEALAAGLSLTAAALMCRPWQGLPGGPFDGHHARAARVAMVAGSGAMVLCGLPLSLDYSSSVSPLMFAGFMACGVCWFAGEVGKLHMVQQVSDYLSDAVTYRQARSLRWGSCGLISLLLLPMLRAFPLTSAITPALFLMLASAALLVFSLLTAATYARASRVAHQQALYNQLLEHGEVVLDTGSSNWHSPAATFAL